MKTNRQRSNSITILMACVVMIMGAASSCKKKEDKPQAAVIPVPNYPKFTDADATLIAIKATAPFPANLPIPQIPGMPTGMDIELNFGMGLAAFRNNAQANKVLLNGSELKFAGGIHTWMPDFSNVTDPSNATGINLNGSISWEVTNPDINKTLSGGMPGTPKITSSSTIQKSGGYTITHTASSNADKVLYTIADGKGKEVIKEQNGNSTSCAFTAAELASFSTSKTAIIQANAYRVQSETIGGKKVYFIRQSSHTISTAEIQ
jgi:hypothetical protein